MGPVPVGHSSLHRSVTMATKHIEHSFVPCALYVLDHMMKNVHLNYSMERQKIGKDSVLSSGNSQSNGHKLDSPW